MEINTILLNLEVYNELRDFKKEIESKNTCRVVSSGGWNNISYISTDVAIKEMSQRLDELEEENKVLRNFKYAVEKHPSISEIKNMSWWQFRKWKKSI